jgi:hypothetical protein
LSGYRWRRLLLAPLTLKIKKTTEKLPAGVERPAIIAQQFFASSDEN